MPLSFNKIYPQTRLNEVKLRLLLWGLSPLFPSVFDYPIVALCAHVIGLPSRCAVNGKGITGVVFSFSRLKSCSVLKDTSFMQIGM
jgi:hypothetical protein